VLDVKDLAARFDVSAESKGVAGTIFVSVDAKGFNTESLESAVESRRGEIEGDTSAPFWQAIRQKRSGETSVSCSVM
jgi:hypothetical protein